MANGIVYKDEPWHSECFTCTKCDVALSGSQFLAKDDRPYCKECYGLLFSPKCEKCCKPIMSGHQGGNCKLLPFLFKTSANSTSLKIASTKFINYENRHWHMDCFKCADCSTQLEGRGFIKDGQDIICGECARIKLAAAIWKHTHTLLLTFFQSNSSLRVSVVVVVVLIHTLFICYATMKVLVGRTFILSNLHHHNSN